MRQVQVPFVFVFLTTLLVTFPVNTLTITTSTRRPPCANLDSYICQHQALNDEIVAAGNDTLKLGEIQQRLAELRAEDFKRRSQQWFDEVLSQQESGDHDHHGRGRGQDVMKKPTDPIEEKAWIITLACLGGIVGIGCLMSIISAGRRTAAGDMNRYQLDEPVTLGQSLLQQRPGQAQRTVIVIFPSDFDDDDRPSNPEAAAPPPDYDEAMRTSQPSPFSSPASKQDNLL